MAAASESLQGPHGPGLGQAFRTLTATVGDGQGGWRAAIHGVAKSRTRLSN